MRRRMLVFGPRAALTAGGSRLEIELAGDAGSLVEAQALPMIASCAGSRQVLHLTLDEPGRDTPLVVREVVRLGGEILAVRPVATSLEEIYLRAVGEADA